MPRPNYTPKDRSEIDYSVVKSRISYDAETGVFRHLRGGGGKKPGGVAGSGHHSGYWFLGLDGRLYAGHRVAWLLTFGEWPKHQVDHVNGVRDDNRLANLRQATRLENLKNKKQYKNNSSGHRGVTFDKGTQKWRAYVQIDQKIRFFPVCATKEEAIRLRAEAERKHYGEFSPALSRGEHS